MSLQKIVEGYTGETRSLVISGGRLFRSLLLERILAVRRAATEDFSGRSCSMKTTFWYLNAVSLVSGNKDLSSANKLRLGLPKRFKLNPIVWYRTYLNHETCFFTAA